MDYGESRSYPREDGRTKGHRTNFLGKLALWNHGKPTNTTQQRIEPFGWDSKDRTYFVLDDNRLYRRTDPPPPPPPLPKPKKNSKKAKAARRASKRRKVSEPADSEAEPADEVDADAGEEENNDKEEDGFGGMIWECLAITLDEFNAFIASIEKSRDPNEKVLRKRTVDEVLPLLEKQEEARKRKQAQKERELLNLEKLATAKRSSRIAGKMEQHKQEEEAREAERKRQAELAMAKKEQEKWQKLEKERESRMMTREQRLKEREARRILHEEELANLSEDSKKLEAGAGRLSERHLKAEIERKKKVLEELTEEEDWIFDCICGAYGQIDDGTHSIACEKCNIWQHSKCVGVSQAEADREDFHFICKTCERRARDAERAKTHPPIKIKLNRPGSSSSSAPPKQNGSPAVVIKVNGSPNHQSSAQIPDGGPAAPIQFPKANGQQATTWQSGQFSSPQIPSNTLQGYPSIYPTQSNGQQASYQRPNHFTHAAPVSGPAPAPSASYTTPYGPYPSNGSPAWSPYGAPPRPSSSHAFSSPHPHSPTSLPPPGQPQAYTFVNGNATQYSKSVANATPVQNAPAQHSSNMCSPLQGSHSFSTSHRHSGPPPAHAMNGPRPGSSDGSHRRSSVNLPSPLAGAPILSPSSQPKPPATFPASSSPVVNQSTPGINPIVSSPPIASSPIPQATFAKQVQHTGHAPVLPPAPTGISPTKHSPPRPSTSNGSFGSATPSVLPPVAALSPSPQAQNLTPPVKSSEPNRPNGQTVAP
jgi:hypothetical protein